MIIIRPNVSHNEGTLGNEVALKHVIFGGHMRNPHWCDGMPAEDFLHNGVDIRKTGTVRHFRKSARPYYSVDLFLCLAQHLRVHGHSQEERFNRTNGP